MKRSRTLIDVVTGITLCCIFVAAGYAILSPQFTSFGTPSADADLLYGYDCNLGACTAVFGGGAFPTLADCQTGCPIPYTMDCMTHTCSPVPGGTVGTYPDYTSCNAALPTACPYYQLDCMEDSCSPITIAGSGWSSTIYNTEGQCNDARVTCPTWVVDCANPARCIAGATGGAPGAGIYRDFDTCTAAAATECSYYKIDCSQDQPCVGIASSVAGSFLTRGSCDIMALTTCGATMDCATRVCTQNFLGEYATQASCTAAIGSVCTTFTANCSTGECDETLAEATPLGNNSFSTREACETRLATCEKWAKPDCSTGSMSCIASPSGTFTDFATCMAAPSNCSSSSSSTPQCCNLDTGMCEDL